MILTTTVYFNDHGCDLGKLVELRGFEPLTPSMRTECATAQTGLVAASVQVSGLHKDTITASVVV